jgi:AAA+ superfamily predicted ATPase
MPRKPLKRRGIVPKAIGDVVGYWRGAGKDTSPVLLAGGRPERRRDVAEGVAGALGIPLYTVDLSFVVNKYMGETEKGLAEVFDLAEAGGALLLFDEADALFGERSAVRSSHARHAKAVGAYLKRRLARYKGPVLLGSTEHENVMDLFPRRRLHTVVVAGRRPVSRPRRSA